MGTLVGERFLIIERLGHGGSGTIYRAEHVTLRRKVAVKVLHHELSRDDLAVERFRREATTVSEIDNDHIVGIHDFGRTADGRLYLAMELLEGETLQDVIKREKRLPVDRTVEILLQLGEALAEAHAMGYVHRDLRPRNIWLASRRGRNNFVKLLDFGLAKLVQHEGLAASTSLGMTFGDPKYMSPEQARGEAVDRRADIYSMGCIAYEMLVGAPPFAGNKVFDILTQHIDSLPEEPREHREDVPVWLSRAVMCMLAKRPEDRFITVHRMMEELREGMQGSKAPAEAGSRKPVVPAVPASGDEPAPRAAAPRSASATKVFGRMSEEAAVALVARKQPAQSAASAAAQASAAGAAMGGGDDADHNQDDRENKTNPGFPLVTASASGAMPRFVAESPSGRVGRVTQVGHVDAPDSKPLAGAAAERAPEVAAPEDDGDAGIGDDLDAPVAPERSGQQAASKRPASEPAVSEPASRPATAPAAPPTPPTPTISETQGSGEDSGKLKASKAGASGKLRASASAASEAESPAASSSRVRGRTHGAADDEDSLTGASGGLSGAWFADVEGKDLDERARKRLDDARILIEPGDTSLTSGDDFYDPSRKPIGKMAAIAGGAIALIVLIVLLWPSGRSGGDKTDDKPAPSTSGAGGAGKSAADSVASKTTAAAVLAGLDKPADAAVPAAAAPTDAGATAQPPATPPATAATPAAATRPDQGTASSTDKPTGSTSGQAKSPRPGRRTPGGNGTEVRDPLFDPYPAPSSTPAAQPTSESAKQAEFFAKLGMQALRNGNMASAASNFKKARELDPKNADAIIGQGEIALRQGSYTNAIAHLKEAARLRSRNAEVHTMLGEAYLGAGNKTQAAASFKKALAINPNDSRAREGLAEATGQPLLPGSPGQ